VKSTPKPTRSAPLAPSAAPKGERGKGDSRLGSDAETQSSIDSAGEFAQRFQVSRETLARLNLYESLVRKWQPAVNLVAPATLPDIWNRHFADSAQLGAHVPDSARILVDLGSGGGFPGLILAILLGATGKSARTDGEPLAKGLTRVILVESDTRKAAFLREVARQTGAPVDILSIRIEKCATQLMARSVDVVTARALAPLDRLLDYAAPLFGPQTTGLFLKGQDAQAEIEIARKHWQFEVTLVPSVTDARASIVAIRNLRALSGV
jgi:16S rRNA (guanine527-N7)-methyltransferase